MLGRKYDIFVGITEDRDGNLIPAELKNKFETYLSSLCREAEITGFTIIPDCKGYWDSGTYFVSEEAIIVSFISEEYMSNRVNSIAHSIKAYFNQSEVLLTSTILKLERI